VQDAPTPPPDPPRQRWRLVLARTDAAPEQTQREVAEAWESAILDAGLPVARSEGPTGRPRIAFGAPLPVGMTAEAELVDVILTERWPLWRVREALVPHVPAGWRLIDIHDVWLAGPPLAGRVAAADYRVTLAGDAGTASVDGVRDACRALLAATAIPRERRKGDRAVPYDLRPLLLDVEVEEEGPPIALAMRTRIHPELGTGRPEEVVAALTVMCERPLEISAVTRVRLILADDLPG
jgi:radical SAM-linked protein